MAGFLFALGSLPSRVPQSRECLAAHANQAKALAYPAQPAGATKAKRLRASA